MVWYSHLFQNFPQFIVIHTVIGFGIVNKAEIDVFLEKNFFFFLARILFKCLLYYSGLKICRAKWWLIVCCSILTLEYGLPWWLSGKEPACQSRRHRFDLWLRKIPGEEYGSPLQYSCLGNLMDRGAWQTTVHGVAKESEMT